MPDGQSVNIDELHAELGIPSGYGSDPYLPRYGDCTDLVAVEPNIIGRRQKLAATTAGDWARMKEAALLDGIELLIVSGFRSIGYQVELFRKKLSSGQPISKILAVNAAPGHSQHHTGTAIDIATRGSRPLTEAFETTPAFDWLSRRGTEFGFKMPYGRANRFGIDYEPWHWSQVDD